ncbi:MAG TPA: 4a-hydroxytetrahydrobiopterin dehydratase [Armatimonadota bacterium]|jgi:4a-hydroxytetrahydrobiopterin dehydratase
MKLAKEPTVPPEAGEPPLTAEEVRRLSRAVPEWEVEDQVLRRELKFPDFVEAMDFVNEVAEVAQAADHHPDLCISYNRVRLELTTHKIGGLSRNDFIVAARIDELV